MFDNTNNLGFISSVEKIATSSSLGSLNLNKTETAKPIPEIMSTTATCSMSSSTTTVSSEVVFGENNVLGSESVSRKASSASEYTSLSSDYTPDNTITSSTSTSAFTMENLESAFEDTNEHNLGLLVCDTVEDIETVSTVTAPTVTETSAIAPKIITSSRKKSRFLVNPVVLPQSNLDNKKTDETIVKTEDENIISNNEYQNDSSQLSTIPTTKITTILPSTTATILPSTSIQQTMTASATSVNTTTTTTASNTLEQLKIELENITHAHALASAIVSSISNVATVGSAANNSNNTINLQTDNEVTSQLQQNINNCLSTASVGSNSSYNSRRASIDNFNLNGVEITPISLSGVQNTSSEIIPSLFPDSSEFIASGENKEKLTKQTSVECTINDDTIITTITATTTNTTIASTILSTFTATTTTSTNATINAISGTANRNQQNSIADLEKQLAALRYPEVQDEQIKLLQNQQQPSSINTTTNINEEKELSSVQQFQQPLPQQSSRKISRFSVSRVEEQQQQTQMVNSDMNNYKDSQKCQTSSKTMTATTTINDALINSIQNNDKIKEAHLVRTTNTTIQQQNDSIKQSILTEPLTDQFLFQKNPQTVQSVHQHHQNDIQQQQQQQILQNTNHQKQQQPPPPQQQQQQQQQPQQAITIPIQPQELPYSNQALKFVLPQQQQSILYTDMQKQQFLPKEYENQNLQQQQQQQKYQLQLQQQQLQQHNFIQSSGIWRSPQSSSTSLISNEVMDTNTLLMPVFTNEEPVSLAATHPHLLPSVIQSDIKHNLDTLINQLCNTRLGSNQHQRLLLMRQRQLIEEDELRLKHFVEFEKFQKVLRQAGETQQSFMYLQQGFANFVTAGAYLPLAMQIPNPSLPSSMVNVLPGNSNALQMQSPQTNQQTSTIIPLLDHTEPQKQYTENIDDMDITSTNSNSKITTKSNTNGI